MSRVRSSSSRQAVAREDRVAKRNPELARVRTGGRCPFFVEVVGFGRAPLPFFPALAGCAVAVSSCSCESQFPFGRSRRRFDVMQWVSAMRVVSVRGGWPNGMVHLLVVAACSCGLPVFRQSLLLRGMWYR